MKPQEVRAEEQRRRGINECLRELLFRRDQGDMTSQEFLREVGKLCLQAPIDAERDDLMEEVTDEMLSGGGSKGLRDEGDERRG